MTIQNSTLRQAIIKTGRVFNRQGLSAGSTGNLSVRRNKDIFITPSGMPYPDMMPRDIVVLDMADRIVSRCKKPSSEWRFHKDIYQRRKEIRAIVHVHAPFATAIACTARGSPRSITW
jgi:L-fuculose-phosphate aldolase